MSKDSLNVGKVVGRARYLHISAISGLDRNHRKILAEGLDLLGSDAAWNVVKFNLSDTHRVSFLSYTDIYSDPFPELLASINVDLDTKLIKHRAHSKANPPILHRKELLLLQSDANFEKFLRFTHRLEELGAFKEIYKFGTKLPWQDRLSELGIEIKGHDVHLASLKTVGTSNDVVKRYRTALKRKKLSSCMGALLDTSLIDVDTEIFDYGCGRGDDISILSQSKFTNVSGWDPHFFPDNPVPQSSDYVTLSFVINVIEDPHERHEVLKKAYSIAGKAVVFSVMLEHQADLQLSKPMNDGFVSSKNTFQKYYDHDEIVALVSEQLDESAVKLAPGVYIVFKDKDLEQEYLFKRQLGLLVDTPSQAANDKVETYVASLVGKMRDQIMSFGRMPKLSELPEKFASQLSKASVSYTRLSRLALSQVSIAELQKVGEVFASEILIFLAINKFERRVKYRSLPEKLQNDVKVHFGSLKDAEEAAEKLLFSLSDTSTLVSSAVDAEKDNLGRLVGNKFRFHSRKLSSLPVNLRLFAKIGERLHRSVNEAEIIQLHLETKKMSYLTASDFDVSPLPRISAREIIKLSNQEVSKFSHQERAEVRILYLKSFYMDKIEPHFEIQKHFDNLVLSKFPELFEEGDPNFNEFAKQLLAYKIAVPKY